MSDKFKSRKTKWAEPIPRTLLNVPNCVPQLVAEEPVALYTANVQVDAASPGRVGAEGEPKRIGAALGDATGEVLRLRRHRPFVLRGVEVA